MEFSSDNLSAALRHLGGFRTVESKPAKVFWMEAAPAAPDGELTRESRPMDATWVREGEQS